MAVEFVPLRDLVANPYRHIERYAIVEEKVEALIQSYENTGFWHGSIQGRRRDDGKVEIGFGHHRLAAAKRAKPKIDPVGVVIADRTNRDMLLMMADKNRTEFKHDALVESETIGAVIEAFERGEVELEAVSPDTNKGHIYAFRDGKAYALSTVARFLGWTKASTGQATDACRVAFDAYHEESGRACRGENSGTGAADQGVGAVDHDSRSRREKHGDGGRHDAGQGAPGREARG